MSGTIVFGSSELSVSQTDAEALLTVLRTGDASLSGDVVHEMPPFNHKQPSG